MLNFFVVVPNWNPSHFKTGNQKTIFENCYSVSKGLNFESLDYTTNVYGLKVGNKVYTIFKKIYFRNPS